MTNAIQDPDRIPADPLLVEAAKRAAELQEKEYARTLRRMNRIAPMIREHMPGYHPDMLEHGKPTMLLWMTHPRTKERTLYVDPEIMKIAQGDFRKIRSEVVSDLEHAPSITHQGAALTESVNDSFSGVIEHGDFMQVHRAMLRFHEIMRQEYGKLVAERKSKLDHPEVTDVMARSQTGILDLMEKIQAFGAMSQEATITLEGLVQAWQREHTPDEPLQHTPYDLAVLRYSRTAEGKAKPMEEYDEADFERINKLCTNLIHDLMSQYAHGFNEENSLVMSWFVGKGFESLKQKQPARRHLKEPGSAPVEVTLKADNDEDGTPFPPRKSCLRSSFVRVTKHRWIAWNPPPRMKIIPPPSP